jgi:hypothetical protein
MIRFYLEIDSILFDLNIVPKKGSSRNWLHPNLRTMFFNSAKEKKEEKEKEGGTVSLWREVIGTIQRLENYRALIEMSVSPY